MSGLCGSEKEGMLAAFVIIRGFLSLSDVEGMHPLC